jgi:hypothetical protein
MYEELVRTLSSCPDAEYGCSNCKYKYSLGCREKLMSDASNAIEKLQEDSIPINDMEIILSEVAKPLWIPVTERLPEKYTAVLAAGNGEVACGLFVGFAEPAHVASWDLDNVAAEPVTHWMPLPEPPEEET